MFAMWASCRVFTSAVNITFRVVSRPHRPDVTRAAVLGVRIPLRVPPSMEQPALSAPPPPGIEESGVIRGEETCAQREEETENRKMTQSSCQKKRTKTKRKRTDSNKSGKDLLTELPFANADISAVFEISRSVHKKEKKKRKIHQLESPEDEKSKKQKRPNYFVSLPITNEKIHDDIQTIQDSILQKDNRLSKAMIPKGSYHITLFVMHLASEEDVSLAISALLECKKPVEEILKELVLVLSFCGLADFKREVLYAQMTQGEPQTTLKKIAETVGKIFEEKGISLTGSKDFIPHLTLMKLSRAPKLRKQGIKKIDTSMYQGFQSHYFGEEFLQRLDLCSMLKKRQPSGYYHTEASIIFGKKHKDENTQTALQRERNPLLDKVKDIKAVLALPETRAKIYKEVFGKRLITQNNCQTLPSKT
ncbi:A-kinase anchoring protein 7 isoform X3 [Hyperolius riggenbachi]|uniref:A-kinase anchoring protein 7 isoform X3 n=1 Tax=Hyperolius riggenbachi TaxID=752182 RepID=UPI0035A3706C